MSMIKRGTPAAHRRAGAPRLAGHDALWPSRFRISERKIKDYRYGSVLAPAITL